MGRGQKTVAVGLPLVGALVGAAYLFGPPPAQWPAAVGMPGATRPEPKAEPPVAPAQSPQHGTTAPAVAVPPGAVAQRRPGARPLMAPEAVPTAPVRLAGMAQPAEADASAPPSPRPGPATASAPAANAAAEPQRPAPEQPPAPVEAVPAPPTPASPAPSAPAVAVPAAAAPDPLAEAEATVQANRQDRARPAPPPPDPRRSETAAMVTRLSGHVAELGNMQRADRADLKALQEEVLRQLEDIRARLTMAEARDSVAALTRVADASAPVQPQRQERRAAAELPPGAPVLGPQSYVVTSASPFLATIAHRNPMPNQPPPPELRLGDAVPGLGKVLGIAQEGTAWVVRTERGPITSGPVTSGPITPAGR